jgi:hypothetical protein
MRTAVLIGSLGLCFAGQGTPAKDAPAETKGMPPRAAPGDYQAQAQAGTVTLAADFTGHSLPTREGPLTSDEFVAVEAALFGPAGAQLKISAADFSLRVNGKKTPLPSQQYGLVFPSLRDPEWVSPDAPAAGPKSKTSVGGGGGGGGETGEITARPVPVVIPFPLQRAMAQRLQRAALPEGDRALPQAGLIFFLYRGKAKSVQAVELVYEGPAGKATLKLQP